jgi:serine/threonine protein kinase
MALEICRTLLTVHTAGWLHKNVRSENILFFSDSTSPGGVSNTPTRPYLAGFAFSRVDSPVEVSDQASEDPLLDIYRHPQGLGEPSVAYAMYMDHYSLGMVLAEIAEWRPLKHIVKKQVDVTNRLVDVPLSALAGIQVWFWRELVERGQIEFRMGEVYGRMVSYLTRPGREDQTERTESLLELEEFVNELGCCRV